MFIEGGKKRPRGFLLEVAFPLTLNSFGGVADRPRCGKEPRGGGPMTGLLCEPQCGGRDGTFHF